MSLRVLETQCLHAADALIWVDGTGEPQRRIDSALRVTFDTRPLNLKWLDKPGQTVLWRGSATRLVPGEANESERERGAPGTFRVAGRAEDPQGRWQPRRFDLTVGAGTGQTLRLFPGPGSTRIGNGGALVGCLRWEGTGDAAIEGRPVPWAVLTLSVTLRAGATQTYLAQSDAKGDFRISLSRLPPLPEGTNGWAAQLSIGAAPTASPADPPDPGGLPQTRLRRLDANGVAAALALVLVPGAAPVLRSFNRGWLGVRPL